MTLAIELDLGLVKVKWHTKNQGPSSNGSKVVVQTDRRTDGQTDGRYRLLYLHRLMVGGKNINLHKIGSYGEKIRCPIHWMPGRKRIYIATTGTLKD